MHGLPPKFLQKTLPSYFFHGAFAPTFIWSRRPWVELLGPEWSKLSWLDVSTLVTFPAEFFTPRPLITGSVDSRLNAEHRRSLQQETR